MQVMQEMLILGSHQFVRLCWVLSVEEPRHLGTKILEVDRFCDIAIEASRYTFLDHLSHNVGRQRDDRHKRIFVGFFPRADVTAGLIAVFSGHMKITLLIVRLDYTERL
jgi:hypothetical protein